MDSTQECHFPGNKRALTARVRKVSGQLRAIERMIEDDRECSEVLMQLVSARRGLKSLAEAILQEHLSHCIGESRNTSAAQRRLGNLLTVLERYVE